MTKPKQPAIEKFTRKDPMGYAVIGLTRGGSPKIWPIYHSDLHVMVAERKGPVRHVFSCYEQGDGLNGQYFEDPIGSQLASIAATAIQTLSELKQLRTATKPKKKGS